MSDTKVQLQVEKWVREVFLLHKFHRHFLKRGIGLIWGGSFEFDAVSDDGKTAVCISTAKSKTAGGKLGIGKCHKILADALYLLHAKGITRRLMVFTERTMLEEFENRQNGGRFPSEIELIPADRLPVSLRNSLARSRKESSLEVTPAK